MAHSNTSLEDILQQMSELIKEAHRRGFSAGVDTIIKSAMQNSEPRGIGAYQFTMTPVQIDQKTNTNKIEPGYRPGTTIERVHTLIKEMPGLTGAEIVETLKERDASIEERTVRTSLGRLRDKWGGWIENKGGKWYPTHPLI